MSVYCWGVAVIFGYAFAGNVVERPDGVVIAGAFILLILIISGVSRYQRSTELRVSDISFSNPESASSVW